MKMIIELNLRKFYNIDEFKIRQSLLKISKNIHAHCIPGTFDNLLGTCCRLDNKCTLSNHVFCICDISYSLHMLTCIHNNNGTFLKGPSGRHETRKFDK